MSEVRISDISIVDVLHMLSGELIETKKQIKKSGLKHILQAADYENKISKLKKKYAKSHKKRDEANEDFRKEALEILDNTALNQTDRLRALDRYIKHANIGGWR